jgi:hypothetical protein
MEVVMSPQAKLLKETELTRLNSLEKDIGKCVVAWDQRLHPADISEEQLKELQAVEKEMDAVLVAYEC